MFTQRMNLGKLARKRVVSGHIVDTMFLARFDGDASCELSPIEIERLQEESTVVRDLFEFTGATELVLKGVRGASPETLRMLLSIIDAPTGLNADPQSEVDLLWLAEFLHVKPATQARLYQRFIATVPTPHDSAVFGLLDMLVFVQERTLDDDALFNVALLVHHLRVLGFAAAAAATDGGDRLSTAFCQLMSVDSVGHVRIARPIALCAVWRARRLGSVVGRRKRDRTDIGPLERVIATFDSDRWALSVVGAVSLADCEGDAVAMLDAIKDVDESPIILRDLEDCRCIFTKGWFTLLKKVYDIDCIEPAIRVTPFATYDDAMLRVFVRATRPSADALAKIIRGVVDCGGAYYHCVFHEAAATTLLTIAYERGDMDVHLAALLEDLIRLCLYRAEEKLHVVKSMLPLLSRLHGEPLAIALLAALAGCVSLQNNHARCELARSVLGQPWCPRTLEGVLWWRIVTLAARSEDRALLDAMTL
jgi:hypothetical protein